ncbi:uncharacterized protein LOC115662812 [Syzygium oleosum]|uniref:uncharacterized protein LOC115662812 n=1 Tax=Syzygium oleosum TaxID=219896 RepID=UPI0011D21453|nr:uncharacterized protein LOC115662812 [Syzygium oleosum]
MEPPSPRPTASLKLCLMCSYSVGVAPRPHSKSLFYHGGETRIVTVDRASAAASPVSSTLAVAPPFALKYQLPDSDLDALISRCIDDDLAIMMDELDRLSSSSPSSPPWASLHHRQHRLSPLPRALIFSSVGRSVGRSSLPRLIRSPGLSCAARRRSASDPFCSRDCSSALLRRLSVVVAAFIVVICSVASAR